MSITIDQLIYDPSTNEGAKVGAFIVDADGHQLDINADGSITSVISGTVDVSGSTVALDPASLAALENITVTVDNEVEITNDVGNPIPVNATDFDIRDLSFSTDKVDVSGSSVSISNKPIVNETNNAFKNSAVAISTTAALLTPTPLSNRKSLLIQNLGSKEIYLGDASVSSSNGVKISAGANVELKYDASIALYARTQSGSADVRILEAANS